MNRKLREKIVILSKELRHIPNGEKRHISFIVNRNNIISIGFNDYKRTHPLAQTFKYAGGIHSELDAYLKIRWNDFNLAKCDMINVRINRFGQLGMSHPCPKCMHVIRHIGLDRIYYTDHSGNFQKVA